MQDFKRNRHAVYRLYYHLVVVTKYRHACITPEIMARLKEIAHDLFNKWGAEVIEMNGESDHVHILFEAPPQVQLSKLVNNFKTVSSRYIRKEFADHLSRYYWKPFFWSRSYMLFTTGGAPLEVINSTFAGQKSKQTLVVNGQSLQK